jgi:hypothetical protein
MTLNVTLVTADRIYQSSDFRLTIAKPFEIIETQSTKLVQLQYDNLDGVLTYTGVGRLRRDSPDLSIQVAKWLEGKEELLLPGIAEIIRFEGDRFLRRVAAQPPRHTFTIAAFENGVPSVALISNFQYADGRTAPHLLPRMVVSTRGYRKSSFVVVTGQGDSVSRSRRRQLQRLGDLPNPNPNHIRSALSRIDELAARSPESKKYSEPRMFGIDYRQQWSRIS